MDINLQQEMSQASQGNVKSMLNVARYYMERNEDNKAYEYLLMAAQKGHGGAEHKVGFQLCFGIGGIEPNVPLGVQYLQSAADKNITHAEFALATVCENYDEAQAYLKENTPPNPFLYYLGKAAKHGHIMAQVMLGDMYAQGKGVERDLHQAVFWWGCAYLHDENEADESRRDARDKLNALLRSRTSSRMSKPEMESILSELKAKYPQYLHFNYYGESE